ncbi:hypothetical protein [Chamaesiphon sp.]|uniref:hypothetical protein n=1 Tax=Chamaesiphon sp. TaxID=2814140 RepID=UPI0035930CC5
MKTSLFLLPALLVVAFSAWMPPAALASDTCNNVDITLTNSTPDEIKITKLEYYDFDKGQYRTETGVFGVDGKQNLERGQSFPIANRDLEKVNDDSTQIRVTYRHRIGGDKYGSTVTDSTPTFTCRDNMSKTVVLNN